MIFMHFSLFIKEKEAECFFQRVSDLILLCVVLNHDVDSSLYFIKMIFSLKIIEKLPMQNDFDSLVTCLKG